MASATKAPPSEIIIISHSPIFYWWPVWFVGFLMAGLTYLDGHRMAIVPPGTVAEKARTVSGHEGPRDVLVLPPEREHPPDGATATALQPKLRMAASNNLGVIFTMTLCLVIAITNIQLRGLWSVIALLGIVLVTIVLALTGGWDALCNALGVFDIHINALGYFSIALFVFVIWVVTVLVYDRQVYTVFSRGQLRVRTVIGAGQQTFDTLGMMVEKHTDDLFRHWLLGFGSGDMTIKTAGTNVRQFKLPNGLRIRHKLRLIQKLLLEREVVGGKS